MDRWARRMYSKLLILYPAWFREQYRSELLAMFDDLWNSAQTKQFGIVRLGLFLLGDVLRNSAAERWIGVYMMLRRWFDITLSLSGLCFGLSVFPVIAILIKLDSPGPVFYTTTRFGKDGQPFMLYKLRTMIPSENDERLITSVGSILRWTRFDEWPQLYNILRGDMTLIGPRPHLQTQPDEEKLKIKPGFLPWG